MKSLYRVKAKIAYYQWNEKKGWGCTQKAEKKRKMGSEKLENRGHIGSVSITIKSCEVDI